MYRAYFSFIVFGVVLSLEALGACNLPNSVAKIRSDGSLPELQEAAVILRDCPDQLDSLAFVLHSIGVVFYNDFDQVDSAIYYMEQAVATWDRVELLQDTLGKGKSNFNLGYFLKGSEQYLAAEPYLRRAAGMYAAIDNAGRLTFAYLQLGQVLERKGAFTEAARYYRLAMNAALSIDDDLAQAKALSDFGGLLRRQQQYTAAIDTLTQALRLFRQAEQEDPDEPACHNQLAVTYFETGDYERSVEQSLLALQGFKDWGNSRRAALVANNLGDTYLRLGQAEQARKVLEEGLAQAQEDQSREIIAHSHDNLGEYYLQTGNVFQAQQSFSMAIHSLLPAWSLGSTPESLRSSLSNSPHKLDLFVYISDLARAQQASYQRTKEKEGALVALRWYMLGDQLLDDIRQGHFEEANKLFWREKVMPFYEAAIACASEVGAVEEGHIFFEKSQAVLLFEAIQRARQLSQVSDRLRLEEQRLQYQVKEIRQSIGNDDQPAAADIQQLLAAEAKLSAFYQSLSNTYPEFSEEGQRLPTVDLSYFSQRYLEPDNGMLIHYFWGQQQLYALAVHDGNAEIHQLGNITTILNGLSSYLKYFEDGSRIVESPASFMEAGYALYQQLLAPLVDELPEQLLIVPSGPLAYLPFEALSVKPAANYAATESYLVVSTLLTYAYSGTLHDQLYQLPEQPTSGNLLAFAPFVTSGNSAYSQLRNSEQEMDELQSVFKGTFLEDKAATRAAFFQQAEQFSLLHLSTHAGSRSTEEQPFIAFYDSLLWMSELYQLHLPADLVVLSACQTNTGELAGGEGVLGLGRGFFYAGARSVVASLWNLNDRHTSQIINAFYQQMEEGVPKSLALQQAKLAFLNDPDIPAFQKSPYFWAGLTFYGNQQPLQVASKWPAYWWGIALLLFLPALWFIIRKRH